MARLLGGAGPDLIERPVPGGGTVGHVNADVDFDCPRCGTSVQERFYGPCATCRGDLVTTLGGEHREVATERFEPAMHVVPNHVATKE